MTSPTAKSDTRRAIRKAVGGRRRKAALRNLGSTAADLPLNVPNANEVAQAKASNMRKAERAAAAALVGPKAEKKPSKSKKA